MPVDTLLTPGATTVSDICEAALHESGAFGDAQTPSANAIRLAQSRLQWMMQQWERKRWMVYHLVDKSVVSTGAIAYSVGPGGSINTSILPASPFGPQFNNQFGGGGESLSARPDNIEAAYLRQINQNPPANQIDFPLTLIQSYEDYSRIRIKNLTSFPGWAFYDPAWPLGALYPWPVPNANIYEVHIIIKEQLPPAWANSGVAIDLPFEYYNAMMLNLAIRLRPRYGVPSYPGDVLPGLAKDAMAVLRNANTKIARLNMPPELTRSGQYNIFGDIFY